MLDKLRSRQDRIRGAALDVDMAVAIAVDAEGDDVLGQHLHLTDFTGPCAGIGGGIEIAVLDHFDQRQQLRAEEFRAAAIMREGHQRVAGVEIALNGAEIRLHGPEGGNDAGWNTEFVFGAGEGGGEFLKFLAADIQTGLADGALGEFQEGLAEDALCTVTREHLRVDLRAGKRLLDRIGRNALGKCVGFHAFEKCTEVAAAGNLLGIVRRGHWRCGEGGAGGKKRQSGGKNDAARPERGHGNFLDRLLARFTHMFATKKRTE